jgi:protein-disulfide isomerase
MRMKRLVRWLFPHREGGSSHFLRFPHPLAVYGLVCLCSAASLLGQNSANGRPNPPVAIVGGKEITEEALNLLVQAKVVALQRQEYEIRRSALEALINRTLLESEASKHGLTVDQLLLQEVDSKIPEPSPEEVEAYYEGQKDRLSRSVEEIRGQMRQSLKKARRDAAREDFRTRLRKEAKVSILLNPPKIEVSYDRTRLRGKDRTDVVIVEFSDFECSHCRAVQAVLHEVLSKYQGKVALAFRDFPVTQLHPQARMTAEAARCAGEQGKFWEYHDLLFSSQKFDRQTLLNFGTNLRLNQANFEECVRSDRFGAEVEADFRDGQRAGVIGTPTFLINGIYLVGEQPESEFERIIDQELNKIENLARK